MASPVHEIGWLRLLQLLGAPVLFFCLFASGPCHAEKAEAPVLFDKWRFGTPLQELARQKGIEKGPGQDLSLPDQKFAGFDWLCRLEFRDDRLVRVSLLEKSGTDRLKAVENSLKAKGFQMLAMRVNDSSLDFLPVLKALGQEELQKRIRALYEKKDIKLMTFAWFDVRNISPEEKIRLRNLSELLLTARSDLREAEISLIGDGSAAPSHMAVTFSLPSLEAQTFDMK